MTLIKVFYEFSLAVILLPDVLFIFLYSFPNQWFSPNFKTFSVFRNVLQIFSHHPYTKFGTTFFMYYFFCIFAPGLTDIFHWCVFMFCYLCLPPSTFFRCLLPHFLPTCRLTCLIEVAHYILTNCWSKMCK